MITADHSKKYLSLVIERTINELVVNNAVSSAGSAFLILKSAAEAENPLSVVFLLSRNKEYRPLAAYFMYIIKKSGDGIHFDNLSLNADYDSKNIIELLFPGGISAIEPDIHEEEGFNVLKEEPLTEDEPNQAFNISEIEEQIVSEEFSENSEDIPEVNYMELVNSEVTDAENEAFEIPAPIEKPVYELIQTGIKEEVFIEPLDEEFMHTEAEESLELPQEKIEAEETEVFSAQFEEELETVESELEEIKREEPFEQPEEKVTANRTYIEYEERLKYANGILKELISSADYKNTVKIAEETGLMKDYSLEMSFELISSLYGAIAAYFTSNLFYETRDFRKSLFLSCLEMIDSLINDKDFSEYSKVITELELLKKEIETFVPAQQETEPPQEEIAEQPEEGSHKKPIELNLKEPVQEVNIYLKKEIKNLETVFNELDNIKGYYKNFEGLRILSSAFGILKRIIAISNKTGISKSAELSEATYIFIKFLQNYRLDPYDSDVAEVFKFIIYNFKLIALNKPTKELNLLISYLNDPVKIFTKNK